MFSLRLTSDFVRAPDLKLKTMLCTPTEHVQCQRNDRDMQLASRGNPEACVSLSEEIIGSSLFNSGVLDTVQDLHRTNLCWPESSAPTTEVSFTQFIPFDYKIFPAMFGT